jgi:long-chain acyl-CoA synthetase
MIEQWLLPKLSQNRRDIALIDKGTTYSYGDLLAFYAEAKEEISKSIPQGAVVAFSGEHSIQGIATFLALANRNAIAAPTSIKNFAAEYIVNDSGGIRSTGHTNDLQIARNFREKNFPGLLLFTSGTTGMQKGVLHDLNTIVRWFSDREIKRRRKIGAFYNLDRIAGIYQLFSSLSSGSCLITFSNRHTDTISEAIDRNGIQLLSTCPSFLNLCLVNRIHTRFNLHSLEQINYGAEPMTSSTLLELRRLFPWITFRNVFGTTELGLIKTKSESNDSVRFQSADPDTIFRVDDGILHVKRPLSFFGYWNSEAEPIAGEWISTNDIAKIENGWIQVLGRREELIKVGGDFVSPVEIEEILQLMPNVSAVSVCGISHPILGQIVQATVALTIPEEERQFRNRLWEFCSPKLKKHQIPQKIIFSQKLHYTETFKLKRLDAESHG